MSGKSDSTIELKYHPVWDRPTRIFHWINVICVTLLILLGTVILNLNVFGISDAGKILIKTIHSYVGYVFAINLIWRLIWGFIGNKYICWKTMLSLGPKHWRSTGDYFSGMKAGVVPQYLGHNPLAKLMVLLLFLLLTAQATTGLVLAGTDLYLPPFGNQIMEWVALTVDNHDASLSLQPGSKEGVDEAAFIQMQQFRKPFITTHIYVFYTLLFAVALHIFAIIVTEIKEKNGLVSAMITGNKITNRKPVDLD